jgi:DNA ligase (NAD+)
MKVKMTRIKELEAKITQARIDYYNNHQTVVSDKVYDAWVDELRTLDPNNKAVTAVGAPVAHSEWQKAQHQIPMGSLDKVNTPEELSKWYNDIDYGRKICITEKLDGISIELVYENGKLTQAITRGNGFVGENIFSNVVKMKGVQTTLSEDFTGSLRGEIIMKKSVHQQHFADKANPRNAASGVSKRLDSVGSEHLNILFYQALGNVEFQTEQEQFVWLRNLGLDTPNWWIVKTDDQVNEFWRKYQDENRSKLDYDIDGLVIRLDSLDVQAALGDKDLRPKGARAFKFDNETRESVIRDIIWQVGNSGRLTPVAVIDPVVLVGATVTRASIYNISYIEELQLDIGATVLVSRANDVIPRIEELIIGTGNVASPPAQCPVCSGELEMQGENLTCTNSATCPAQVVGRIKNWISELNLLEWGDALIERLVASGKVSDVADLYKLSIDDLSNIDRMGEKSATKCHDILWENSEIPLEVFLGGLSIPMIGQSTIKLIINAGCDSLEKFGQLKAENFEQVPGLGPVKAQSLAHGLLVNRDLILRLLENGVKIKSKAVGVLTGKSICFTGTMRNKRPVLEKMAADAGGDVKSSVGKGLSYLVIADPNSTTSKAVAARKFGTQLISEEEFLEMVK